MYDRLIRLRGAHQDRCVLYVFRCAVYYASRARHDPETLEVVELERRESRET